MIFYVDQTNLSHRPMLPIAYPRDPHKYRARGYEVARILPHPSDTNKIPPRSHQRLSYVSIRCRHPTSTNPIGLAIFGKTYSRCYYVYTDISEISFPAIFPSMLKSPN